jgi:hypothetical protein
MQLSITIPFFFTLAILASVASTLTISRRQNENMQVVAGFANKLNHDIVFVTQFLEDFPTLSGPALTTQGSAAISALHDANSVINSIALNLPNNAMAQVLKGSLFDNDFLLNLSLQLQDFVQGMSRYILTYHTY